MKLYNGIEVTTEQFDRMNLLIKQHGKSPDKIYIELGYGALMCVYDDLHIGIEKDGYAHT